MKNVDLQKIIYMNTLIAHRRTGTPEVFAQKLNLSRSALFEYLTFLRKDLMLEILYSCYSQTYYYGEGFLRPDGWRMLQQLPAISESIKPAYYEIPFL